jgi:DNA-binding NarL/FixJ family response regulator
MKSRTTRHRILIVDDHVFIRRGLTASLSIEEDIEVVGEAGSASEALARCRYLRPDIAVIDQRLGMDDGATLVGCLRTELPELRCIVISSFETEEDIHRALRAGAFSYVSKAGPADHLLDAIRAAAGGRQFLSPEVARVLAARDAHAALSPRELDVLRQLASGASNKEIGAALGISAYTVKQYVASLLAKLRVSDRSQAVLEALRRGLVRDITMR